MSELETQTAFPRQEPVAAQSKAVQYCRLRYTTLAEDDDVEIVDLYTPSAFDQYYPETEQPFDLDEDSEEAYWYVELTFFTSNGEESRYFDDSQDTVYRESVMSRILTELGNKGWEAITVMENRESDPCWYLKRVIDR
ncbi:MAG TPA: hypothetical protein VF898_07020 [Chloroflexota bacterium]